MMAHGEVVPPLVAAVIIYVSKKLNPWIREILFSGSFANNPQYRIKLTDSDPNDDDELCTLIVAVMQKYRRELKHAGLDNLAIGFAMYEVCSFKNPHPIQRHMKCRWLKTTSPGPIVQSQQNFSF